MNFKAHVYTILFKALVCMKFWLHR